METKSVFCNLHSRNPLSHQVFVDRGELAAEARELNNFLDGITEVNFVGIPVVQLGVYGILALVAFDRATSAVLQNFQENVDITLLSKEGELVEEKKTLKKEKKSSEE